MNSIDNQKSNQNYIINKEKKFCENEILKKLLAKIEKLEGKIGKLEEKIDELENENKELKNENKELKSNNNNNTLINNNDKSLNGLKDSSKNFVFGSRNDKFDMSYLNKLIFNGNLIDIQNYISSYYCKVDELKHAIIFFDILKNKLVERDYYDFNRMILKPITKLYSNYHKKFDFTEWFHSTLNPIYRIDCNVLKPKAFVVNGDGYVNLTGNHLHIHKEFKPFNSYPKDIQIKVQFIWNHIKKMWCSNKEDQFKYVHNWIVSVVTGKKMKTCVYLQSPQGIGKSLITNFLSEHVLGDDVSFTYSEVSSFLKFNGPLMGRLLIVFEEVPSADKYEWVPFSNRLKYCLKK
jgi:hypothetical protein